MNTFTSRSILILVIITFLITTSTFSYAYLTPEQLVLIMKASRERYRTIDEKLKAFHYERIDDTRRLTWMRDIESRWSRKKHFFKIVGTSYDDTIRQEDYSPITIETYSISETFSKYLREVPDGRNARGYIEPNAPVVWERSFLSVYDAMWNLFDAPWERMRLKDATVDFEPSTNYYILKVAIGDHPKANIFTLWIDPHKDYIPIKREFFKTYDATTIVKTECSNFRRTSSGLWVPYRYCFTALKANFEVVYEVERVIVNDPIPDNMLDFNFPIGTIVNDRRYNLRYTAGEKPQIQSPINVPISSFPSNAKPVPPPVTDEDLLAAASKAKAIAANSNRGTEHDSMIEIWPKIILVTPSENTYTLFIQRCDGSNVTLSAYSFKSQGLNMRSLKNSLLEEDRLVIDIEKLESYNGFASGTLTLEFAGHTNQIQVTFVSPP